MASKSRKRHAPITDIDSDESLTASQSQSKSSVPKKPYVPRFLIIHSEVEGKDISLLSPFLIHKTIMSMAGEPKSIKNLRSGDLLIQCAKEPHEKSLLKMKTFCGLKCSVTPHKSLNTSKGIVRCPALIRQSNEHILEFMGEQGVTDVRRINVHRDGVLKPTNTFVFTFNTPELPTVVKIGFIQAKVDVYVPNPLRCYQCQVYGHHENKCSRQAICINCGMPEHCASGQCQRAAKCVNCSGDHPANFKECPQWEKEKKILKIKCEQNLSFPEARKQYEQFYQARTYASAVKPGTCNKSTETDTKSTQIDDSFTEYLMRKEEEKKKKEEKDKLKKQQKDERRQQYIKEKAQKEKEEAEKAILAQKNPFSVFKKDDEGEDMEDDSVVFTDSSSSDHLPKGTLSRLPTT